MKALTATTLNDMVRTPTFVRITAFVLLSLSVFFLFNRFTATSPSLVFSSLPRPLYKTESSPPPPSPPLTATTSSMSPPPTPSPPPPSPPPPKADMMIRMGIVDETGAMSLEFEVGDIDEGWMEEEEKSRGGREEKEEKEESRARVKVGKYKVCEQSMSEYIPCIDNVEEIRRLNLSASVERYERHCPQQGKGLACVVPRPEGYQVWLSNVPHTGLVEDKDSKKWILIKKDKFIFQGGGRAIRHLNRISKVVPDIAFGQRTRVALDIGCGVADFGAFLMQRNVATLSIAPKDVHKNQIQFALERGVPAMVVTFATHRLLYPSQAFDFIHCLECGVNWTLDDGMLLLEANRMLRAGGYFIWAAEPVYKREKNLRAQWAEMEDLTSRICWELVKKEAYIAIWRKPLNNSCYLNRDSGVQPRVCDSNDDPDNVWYDLHSLSSLWLRDITYKYALQCMTCDACH